MMANSPDKEKYYRQLARNIIGVIVAVSLTPLALISVISYSHFDTAYKYKVTQQLGELVNKHSQTIDRFLFDRLADLRVLARNSSLSQLQDPNYLADRLRVLREEYGLVFVDLGLVRADGLQVSYAGPLNLTNANYAGAEWFKRTLTSEDFISDVFEGLRAAPHFIVAVKKQVDGREWILRSTIDFKAFNQLVDGIRIGQTGFAFVLNRRGEFQTNAKPKVFLDRGPDLDFLKARMDARQVSVTERPDEKGGRWIVALAPMKSGQWVLGW